MFDMINVIKAAGRALGFGDDKSDEENSDVIQREIRDQGLDGADNINVKVEKDKIILEGDGLTQEAKEKILMAAANIQGVSGVQDKIRAAKEENSGTFYTVQSGDTLSKIAQEQYGKASAYPKIFEANRPMLADPDKIYPGQLLRIPPRDS